MKLQTHFILGLGGIACIALLLFLAFTSHNIAQLQQEEIEDRLSSHLTLTQNFIDNVLDQITSDLDLLRNDGITKRYFAADDVTRYQLFHSELTRTANRYLRLNSIYSEIAIVLPDGFKDINVNSELVDEQEEDLFLLSVLPDINADTNTPTFFIEQRTESQFLLVAYQPILQYSNLVTSEINPVVGFMRISVDLRELTMRTSSTNIWVSFQYRNNEIGTRLANPDQNGAALETGSKEYTSRSVSILPELLLKTTLLNESVKRETEALYQQSIVLNLLIIFSLIIVTIVLLRLVIIRPLNQFTRLIERSDIDSTRNAHWQAYENNEFGRLKQRFDQLMRRIKDSSIDLQRQAFTDTLTGLPNRAALYRLLQRQTMRNSNAFSVMFLDLDGFKQVNDIYGHDVGDELLIEVGKRLSKIVRGHETEQDDHLDIRQDVVIRLGGDEFTIVLMDKGNAEIIADRILHSFQSGIQINDRIVYAGTSIGISEFPKDSTEPALLIQYADLAMYQAKKDGKMRYCRYSSELADIERQRLAIEETVREGIELNRFEAHFQAKVNANTKEVVGFEALARLRDAQGRYLPPSDFIPTARENGVLEYITYKVTEQACILLERLGNPEMVASINISPSQLNDMRLIADIRTIMWRYHVLPSQIEFEVTEEELISNFVTTRKNLTLLRKFGFRTALDDFGSGYSSLGHLKKFQFDTLKLDRVFVSTEDYDSISAAGVVNSIKSLADTLQMAIVAEGVETKDQLNFIQSFGVNIIQGYYFAKPLPEAKFIQYYHAQHDQLQLAKSRP